MESLPNSKPVEKSNATTVEEICSSVIPFTLLRFDSVADHYMAEPYALRVQRTPEEEMAKFEQVLRIRKWSWLKTEAWLVYAEERHWVPAEAECERDREEEREGKDESDEVDEKVGGVVLRYVVWERKVDKERVRALGRDNRNHLLNTWPTLDIQTVYLSTEEAADLVQKLIEFDRVLQRGIPISDRNSVSPCPTWNDYEMMRQFDWGQVKATWSHEKESAEIERIIERLEPELETLLQAKIQTNQDDIFGIKLDYNCLPDLWKSIVEGNLVLPTIYNYYPKNVSFDDPEYAQHAGYQRLLAIRQHFRKDRSLEQELFEQLQNLLPQYAILNWCDVENLTCLEYRILLHPNQPILDDDTELMSALNGVRYDLHLYVSMLRETYTFYINRTEFNPTTNEWKFSRVKPTAPGWKTDIEKIRTLFERLHYEKLSDAVAITLVPDVETEFVKMGEVSVFHCLFTDLETITL